MNPLTLGVHERTSPREKLLSLAVNRSFVCKITVPCSRSKGLARDQALSGGATARMVMVSKRWLEESGFPMSRSCTSKFTSFRRNFTSRRNRHLFVLLSINTKHTSGRQIAKGTPGNPAPDPISKCLPDCMRNGSSTRLSLMCRSSNRSRSPLETNEWTRSHFLINLTYSPRSADCSAVNDLLSFTPSSKSVSNSSNLPLFSVALDVNC